MNHPLNTFLSFYKQLVNYINNLSPFNNMKLRYYLLICFLVILLSGCRAPPEIVEDTRIVELQKENEELKGMIAELESQISSLKDQLNLVIEERDKYLKELDEFYLTEITGDVDLIYWTDEEIARALGEYNEKFKDAAWKTYTYRREEKDFYWQFDPSLGFVADPFFELRLKDQDSELDVFHFRIERFAIKNNRTLAQEKYDEYLKEVLKESQADLDLRCFEQTTCRDIKVIKCVKDNKDYHSWFEGSRLFTTRFDGREALDAFEKLYCHPGRL